MMKRFKIDKFIKSSHSGFVPESFRDCFCSTPEKKDSGYPNIGHRQTVMTSLRHYEILSDVGKIIFIVLLLFTFHLSLFTSVEAKVYIDITSPSSRKLPIAIMTCRGLLAEISNYP
jgi:hypothetical protein